MPPSELEAQNSNTITTTQFSQNSKAQSNSVTVPRSFAAQRFARDRILETRVDRTCLDLLRQMYQRGVGFGP
jgi:hypothetical protein